MKEICKTLNGNTTQFDFLAYTRALRANRKKAFVDRYNNNNIPKKYKFKEIDDYYTWTYKIDSNDLRVRILRVTETSVLLECERNRNIKEIEITEPPYMDIYNSVYQFLVETVENVKALVEAEAALKF